MAKRHVWIALTCWLAVVTVSQRFAFAAETVVAVKSQALAHYILATAHEFNGESTQALDEYRQAVKLDPTQTTARLKLAAYDIRYDHFDDAIAQLKSLLAIDPNMVKVHYLLALVYSSQKKFDLAAQEYEAMLKKASDKNPASIEVYAYLAQLYYAQGQMEKAVAQFKKILSLDSINVGAHFLLGSIYLDRDQRADAIVHFQKVLAVQPDHDGALNALAYTFAEEGVQLPEARRLAHRAIELDPASGAYYDTYGWVLFKQGLYEESLKTLQKAETLVQDPIIYEHLGDVYKATNKIPLARKFWMKSLSYDAKQPNVQHKLEILEKTQALETRLK